MNKPAQTQPRFTLLGLSLKVPTHPDLIIAVVMSTALLFVSALFLPLEDGPHAASRWGALFAASLHEPCGLKPFSGARHFMVALLTTFIGLILAGFAYGMIAALFSN